MSKRKSRGSRETSKLLEQMGLADDDEAPAVPQVLPEARAQPKPHIAANVTASPRPAKPRSRAVLWALVILLAVVGGATAAAFIVFGARP